MSPRLWVFPAKHLDGGCGARSLGDCHGEVSIIEVPTGSNVTTQVRLCYRHLERLHEAVGTALAPTPK